MEDDLIRRLDRPLAWLTAFGGSGLVGGAMAGLSGRLPGGPIGGALIVGACVGAVGLLFGMIAWGVCRLIGGLDRPVRRPEFWGQAVGCLTCGWRNGPEGPWRVRDCLTIADRCLACGGHAVRVVPDCPCCGANFLTDREGWRKVTALVRLPRAVDQAIWGHHRCRECGGLYDKWGREVRPS